jgi:putative PEP-CTERM system histidine kinase
MVNDFNALSHAVAFITYGLLAILIGSRYMRRNSDRALFFAALVSALWAAALVTQSIWGFPDFAVRYLLELLRDGAWIALIFTLLSSALPNDGTARKIKQMLAGAVIGVLVMLLLASTAEHFGVNHILSGKTKIVGELALALIGLLLIEQIWRNSLGFRRYSIKYMCTGVATIFIFDFVMYADALLFGQISQNFWDARGLANALLVPLFAVNVVNTRRQPIDFRVSRRAAFHVGTLLFAGAYLVFLSVAGYYIKTVGGSWGDALRILFFTLALVFLATLLLSRRLRARMMVAISQNFFDYKYDYRNEWLKMTKELANLTDSPPLPERVIRILADLVESNAGAIWLKDDQNRYQLKATINMGFDRHTLIDPNDDLVRYFCDKEWIIDLNTYKADPVAYDLLEVPDILSQCPNGWLIIPVYSGNELYGMALIGAPLIQIELNWENFDLIRVVARQTGNLLAQADAQSALTRAMQFEAVSKASAFMLHDLKTVIAQLSLLVKNAPRHRDNPAFIDDMIQTTDHAVNKISNLVTHIQKPQDSQGQAAEMINLTDVLRSAVADASRRNPKPHFDDNKGDVWIRADAEQLSTVVGHLLRNAQEATPPGGDITVTLKVARGTAVVFIQDSGSGMTAEFIRNRLFQPFESTKGLTGMGIGVYQTREYLLDLGGSIDVTSEPGVGSCFSMRLPLADVATSTKTPAATNESQTSE